MGEKFFVEVWSLRREMEFIDALGSLSDIGPMIGRIELLRRYREAIERRVNWDQMRPGEVARLKAHLDAAIAGRGAGAKVRRG